MPNKPQTESVDEEMAAEAVELAKAAAPGLTDDPWEESPIGAMTAALAYASEKKLMEKRKIERRRGIANSTIVGKTKNERKAG
jgi:hypothetical protein